MQTENLEGQESIFGRDSGSGKMSSALSQVGGTLKRVRRSLGRIFKKSSKRSSKLKNHTFMLLDLRPGAGNMLGAYWEYDPPWLGSFGTLNTSECPKDAVECSLWQILQATAPSRYSLSQTACLGILRRAACRGKSLPPLLEAALRMQAGLDPPAPISGEAKAYECERDFAVWMRFDSFPVLEDCTVIFGHTPTIRFQYDNPMTIWDAKSWIGIDCGCMLPEKGDPWSGALGRLSCLRLDDMQVFYSEEPQYDNLKESEEQHYG